MKKSILFVAVATLFLFSCAKVNVPEKEDITPIPDNSFVLTASIDGFATKADIVEIDAQHDGLVWAKGDHIGVYVNGWSSDSNQQFDLVGEGGSATGSFVRHSDDWFETDQAKVAFFPWDNGNNVSAEDGKLYITLPEHNGSDANPTYTSGKMLTPLVAAMSFTDGKYPPLALKHAGAAIKVTINNLPTCAHSISMESNQPVYGYFNIDPSNAGTVAMQENTEDGNNDFKKVWLHFTVSDTDPFVFIFPTPELTTPGLKFEIFDENDVKIWSKKLKKQTVSLGHGDILVMDPINISYYDALNAISSTWTVIGTGISGDSTGWQVDFPMATDGDMCVAKGLTFSNGGAFKVRRDKKWEGDGDDPYSYPASNYEVPAGTYDIIYNMNTHSVKAVTTGACPYPTLQNSSTQTSGFTAKEGFTNSGWVLN